MTDRRDTLARLLRENYGDYFPTTHSAEDWQADADDLLDRIGIDDRETVGAHGDLCVCGHDVTDHGTGPVGCIVQCPCANFRPATRLAAGELATFTVTIRAGDLLTAMNIAQAAASLVRAEFGAITTRPTPPKWTEGALARLLKRIYGDYVTRQHGSIPDAYWKQDAVYLLRELAR